MALKAFNRRSNPILDEARRRLRANPDDNLDDLYDKLDAFIRNERSAVKTDIFVLWILDIMFEHDYESLQVELAKCKMLDPSSRMSRDESVRLLRALWKSCKLLFFDDWDEVSKKITERAEESKRLGTTRLFTSV